MRALITACVAAFLLAACGNKPDPAPLVAKGKINITGSGFYSSEDPVFNPSSIDYDVIDQKTTYLNLDKRLEKAGYTVVSAEKFFNTVLGPADSGGVVVLLNEQLKSINAWLQTSDITCGECSSLTVFEIAENKDWGPDDRWVIVFGLETRSDTTQKTRAGFGAFMFDGTGEFVSHSFRDYDFTAITTQKFSAMLDGLLTDLDIALGDDSDTPSEDK